jgi:hypothetical protein
MTARRWQLALAAGAILLAACPPPPPPPPPPRRVHRPPPPPPAAGPGEWVRSAPALRDRAGAVQVSLLGRGLLSFAVGAGDAQVWLRGWGGSVRLTGGQRFELPRRHYVWTEFSPGGRYLGVTDEQHRLEILGLPGGRPVARAQGATDPHWLPGDTIAFRRGCEAWRLAPDGRPQRIGSAPPPCGEMLWSDADYRFWVLGEPGPIRRGVFPTYRSLRRIDLVNGRSEVLFSGSDDEAVMAPRVAPGADRICWLDPGFALQCRQGSGAIEQLATEATRPLEFDDRGERLLYATGDRAGGRIVVVEFASRRIVELPRAGREWWTFLPGGQRLAGHGGASSGLVYDLAGGWRADVGDPGAEWEGLWTFPDDASRLVIGRERGGTRDLYLAAIAD